MPLRRSSIVILSVAAVAVVVVACGGRFDAGDSAQSACERLADAITSDACGLRRLPADEAARERPAFLRQCLDLASLPGSGWTSGVIDACARGISTCTSTGCERVPGTSPAGAPCIDSIQCASLSCAPSSSTDGCGKCVARVPLGGACELGGCVVGAVCSYDDRVCVAPTYADAGGACNSNVKLCKDGLACSSAHTCAAPASIAGATCDIAVGCVAPLRCTAGTCARPLADGAACSTSSECTFPSVCNKKTSTCSRDVPARAGEPCGDEQYCAVGNCPPVGTASNAVCPTILADGAPCDAADVTKTCDVESYCANGKCQGRFANKCQ